MTTQTAPEKDVYDIIEEVFDETIAHYRKSPRIIDARIVVMLNEMLTRLQQQIASDHRCRKCCRGGQWVLMPHFPCNREQAIEVDN